MRMGVVDVFKVTLGLQVVLLWGMVLGNPTLGNGLPRQCPGDSTCKLVEDCTGGYYMTTDMQAFHCGPIRDVESMVCCYNYYNPPQPLPTDTGTSQFNSSGQNAVDHDDHEVEIDVVPEFETQPEILREVLEDEFQKFGHHHVESHDIIPTLEDHELRETVPTEGGQKVLLPLPDLPQDRYDSPPRNEETGYLNRNPTDALESKIFDESNHHQESSYRRNQPPRDQFSYQRGYESRHRERAEPFTVRYRARDDNNEEFHASHSRRDRYQPVRDYRQSYQAQREGSEHECPCEKGDPGPPGPKGEPGEPGKIIYIPVYVSPSGHPVSGYPDNLPNVPKFQDVNGGLLHQQMHQAGPEFLDNANQAYQYAMPSPHLTHPSPTFMHYAVPVETPSAPPHPPEFGSQGSTYNPHYQYHSPPPPLPTSGGSQGPNFPQGFSTQAPPSSGYPSYAMPPTVRHNRYPML